AFVGLGHRRLSIIDLSEGGHQPMHFNDLSIVFNGEIYNYQEIAKELKDIGYTFQSGSDTEVILKAFDRWGVKAVDRFIGMFAFVLYDKAKGEVLIFRDRAGVKPVYVYNHNGIILVASELKSFHKHPRFEKEIDINALGLFLQYNYIPTPYCIFKNTQKLEPGHFLKVRLSDRQIEQVKYWDVVDAYNKPKLNISYDEAVEETERILKKSFKYRMVADVPVGLFLSGGYDSSAVTALLQSEYTQRLKTFTIGYKEHAFNEADEAEMVAKHLGTDHVVQYCTADDASDILEKLPFIYDEPFADNSVVPTYLVSKLAKKHVKVVLSGDAGDEIFAGYDKFNRSMRFTSYPRQLQSLLSGIMNLVPAGNIPLLKKAYNFDTRYEKMQKIWESKDPNIAMKLISQYITESEAKRYLQKSFVNQSTYFDIGPDLNENNDALNKLLAIDYKTFLLDNNLTKVDRATMSVSLEGREPILDHNIIEFVSQLPSSYKIRDGVNKHLLKTIVHKYVPKSIMERPKKPFVAPLGIWFKDELKQYYYDFIDEKKLKEDGIFSTEVLKLRDQFMTGTPVNHQKLWNILMFQIWKEKWM
ncbi:MAG: asparagine synthase (glutamine-hydrolyzing), partial [Fulvivirga sp.]|nr:asparagine synthase (glutamine-hydrolyzing) [Fulvivirga sp.]